MLWMHECINDLFEAGMQNYKLVLLFKMNQNAKVAVKTPLGMTEGITMKNIIMQGTVWGSIFCTNTMDKLPKKLYKYSELLCKYKGEVTVPPLEMVDDILTVQKCGMASEKINTEVNLFVEQKKLTLGFKKCVKVHVGKK